jgi:MoaA/NifB/PqqE/SkfB family radical SAM enzyme
VYDIAGIVRTPGLIDPLRASVAHDLPPPYLRSAKIKLTARCNLKCTMCRFGRGWAPPELDEASFSRILEEMAALGCRKVHFSGGEPFVRADIERLVATASGLGMKATLTTNLTLLDKHRVRALIAARPSSVSTSLDAARPKLHDRIRGIEGSFRRTTRSLSALVRERERRGRRTRFRVNFTIMRQNYFEYPALVELAASLGACEVNAMPVDDGDGPSRLRLGLSEIRDYNAVVAPRVLEARVRAGFSLDARFVYPFGTHIDELRESARGRFGAGYYRAHLCYSPYLHLFVAWDGKVYLCCMTDEKIEPLGDLSRESVASVFSGERFQAIRAEMKRTRLVECHRCDMVLGENRALAAALVPHRRAASSG